MAAIVKNPTGTGYYLILTSNEVTIKELFDRLVDEQGHSLVEAMNVLKSIVKPELLTPNFVAGMLGHK